MAGVRTPTERTPTGAFMTDMQANPGTRHTVVSPEGCLVLAVWQSGVQLVDLG